MPRLLTLAVRDGLAACGRFQLTFGPCLAATLATLFAGAIISAPAQVVISEIHYHPVEEPAFNADGTPLLGLTNDLHEFVEIQNAGAASVNLSGWTLAGGLSYTFPTNAALAAGAFQVIAKNPARLATVYSLNAAEVLGPYSGYLGNGSDTVRLRDAAGNAVDAVTYDSKFPWPAAADALGAQDRFTGLSATNYQYKGRSLQRVSVTWPSGDPANWLASPLSGPTPGAAQAVTRTIPKPVVVAQSAVQSSDGAVIVRANQTVTVNCTYSATNSLSSVTLEYFVDNMNSTAEPRATVSMTALGSGKYTASLPGQTNRSIVRYRFKADRGDGLEVVSPRTDDPQIAPIGTGGAREAWWGYFVTPVRASTNPIYDVLVSTASLVTMSNNIVQNPKRVTAATATGLPRDIPYVAATAPQWNGTVPGVFANNGEVWDIQIRHHGSYNHRAPNYYSYKLHFPSHLPFNGQSSWFETLHSVEFTEATKLNRLLGLPASKMRTVDWYYNNNAQTNHNEQGEYAGEMLDAYHELQQQLNPGSDQEATGELYKNVGNRNPSQNNLEGPYTRGDEAPLAANAGWTQLQRYDWTIALQNNSWKGPKPIRDLIEGMWTARGDSPATHKFSSNATTLASARAWFTNNWDIDTTITSMALVEWMGVWDDAAQNHFFWRRASGKWVRLGWDYDRVMYAGGFSPGPEGGFTNQTIYSGEYGAPTVFDGVNWWKDTFYKCFRTEYNQRLWELNNSFFHPTNLAALGFTRATTYAPGRRAYVNSQLAALGTYYQPGRPTNTYPANGGSVVSATNLVTSAYSHPRFAPHYSTKWEIRSASGDYEEPVLRLTSTNSMTAYPIPFDQLTYGQTYYWRATYMDTNSHPSIVSAETSFTWGTSNPTAGTLVINEVLANNRGAVQNDSLTADYFPDYIELRNNGSASLALTGYSLTDDPLTPAKYIFPSGTTLAAGTHLLVWCDSDTSASGLHAGFGLDADGETVLLMNGSAIVDCVSFGPQAPDVAIGRIVNGTGGWQANTPTPGTANSAQTLGSASNLRINEWLADPAYGDDWFELYNADSNVVALAGLYLSDTPSTPAITQIPPLSFIEGKGFARFWADGNSSGGNHCNFKLSKSGESLLLTAANGATTLDTITFSSQTTDVAQGRLPDGAATIVTFSSKTASPGYCNWAPTPVYVNEVLANTASPFEDAVEIFNPTAGAVSIGGWWLSDYRMNRQKFSIPAGTTVPAGGYVAFYRSDFEGGAVPFALSEFGDEVMLSAVDSAGALTGYGSLARFGPAAENVSFGRVAATGLGPSSGSAEFWPQSAHTFGQDNPANVTIFRTGMGAANAAPQIGPVTINEIMYHPPDFTGAVDDTRDEFIELHNLTTNTVSLAGWRLRGDSDFTFPAGAGITANGYLLLVSFDPTNTATLASFRTYYNLTNNAMIIGPYAPNLANSSGNLEIACPTVISGYATYINVDKVEYRDLSPWPTTPDGGGKSLQRASSGVIGNTAANWTGNPPTPGAVNLGLVTSLSIATASPLTGGVRGSTYTNTFTATGGSAPYSWTITAGSVGSLLLASDGTLSGTPAPAGTNTFTVQVTDNLSVTAAKQFTLIIAATAPGITTAAPLAGGKLNAAYSQALAASGGTPPYTWSLTDGALPGGVALNSAGVISGTPTNDGAFSFTARISDYAGLTATKSFTLAISAAPLTITSVSPMVNARQGDPYSQALTAVGGVTPYSWGIASGALPPGLKLSAPGDVTGTPTNLGTYNFIARVTDSASNTVTQALAITVTSPTLTIATALLPDSIVGATYAETLSATGGTMPYTWSLVWGALPDGLSLSIAGMVNGSPTNGGTFSFIVQVADNAGATATQIFTIAIQNNAPAISVRAATSGVIQLLVSGDAGLDYTIESSTNFLDWATVFTTNAPAMPFQWTDPDAAANRTRFYRANCLSTVPYPLTLRQ